MRIAVLIFVFLLILSGCENPYPGFSQKGGRVFVKLHRIGDDDLSVGEAHFVRMKIALGNLYEGIDYQMESEFQKMSPEYMGKSGLGAMICKLHAGDSASYIIPYDIIRESLWDEYGVDERSVPDTLMMQLHIGVDALLTETEYTHLMQERILHGEIEENNFLRSHLAEQGVLASCDTIRDVYIQHLRKTDGERIKYGLPLEVNYVGHFLDGREFDNTVLGSSTLWFDLGKPDQVVKGLELALSKMNSGDSVRVFVPSHMGFGQNGSTTGVVPPLTPVYFDLSATIFEVPDTLDLP